MEGKAYRILYIHGMGGGADSRIPAVLSSMLPQSVPEGSAGAEITVRTYSFDPAEAAPVISEWVRELSPDLVIGESLGAVHAIRIKGIPHILVSPSLGAPRYLGLLGRLAVIPWVRNAASKAWRPKKGDRQKLVFAPDLLRGYPSHGKAAFANSPRMGSSDSFFAFFGRKDHYRKSGVVSLKTYRKYFGDTFQIYDGTHFMEEEFIRSMLVPKIWETLLGGKS